MSNLKDLDFTDVMKLTPQELKKKQLTQGWAMSLVGYIMYGVLRLFCQKPKYFYGVCPYFTIGKSWGGISFGWFFICGKNSGYGTQVHELGHLVQNAKIGGVRMVGLSIASVFRYWKHRVFTSDKLYDTWWFEGQATQLGEEYLSEIKRREYFELTKGEEK